VPMDRVAGGPVSPAIASRCEIRCRESCARVRTARGRRRAFLLVYLLIPPRVRCRPVGAHADETVSSRRPDASRHAAAIIRASAAPDPGDFTHPVLNYVEHFAERVAEYSAIRRRAHGTDALLFPSEVAFDCERDPAGRSVFESTDVELLADRLGCSKPPSA